jgi:hypothetical protein
MFPNWSGWKTVKLVLFVLGTVDGALIANAANEPASLVNVANVAVTVLGVVGTLVVALSGTAVGPALVKDAK